MNLSNVYGYDKKVFNALQIFHMLIFIEENGIQDLLNELL